MPGTTRRRLIDVAVAAVATAQALGIAWAPLEAGTRPPGLLGVGLLLVAGGALLGRRRWPVPVLLVVLVTVYLFLILDHSGGAELPLLAVAVYTAAAHGHRWWVFGVTTFFVVSSFGYRLLVDREPLIVVAITAAPLVLVALLGDGVAVRGQLRAEVRERLRVLEAEKELEAEARVTAERLRVAHELHDVLAHTITTMSVQAAAAADGLPAGSDERRTLESLRASARDAMQQLRATITVLRSSDGSAELRPSPGLADLAGLMRTLAEAGVDVEVEVHGTARSLPAEVDLSAYRIIQEALTNVLRHAGTDRARVEIRHGTSALHVTVADEGRAGPRAGTDGGFGIVGMRERALAVGGRLSAGPQPDGGFRVHAVLPAGEVAS